MEEDTFRSIHNHSSKMNNDFNIAIIGGGPAGVSAGIYSKYDGNNPIILEAKKIAWIPENHINLLERIEGFPGLLNTINGTELVDMFRNSLSEMQVEYRENEKVIGIEETSNGFIAVTSSIIYKVDTVIIATGTKPLLPSVQIDNKALSNIHLFAYDTYQPYIGKNVTILGSRNSGSTAAIYLAKRGVKVTVIELKKTVQAKLKHTQHFESLGIKVITGANVNKVKVGTQDNLEVFYKKEGKLSRIHCAAMYSYIGVAPENKLAKSLGVAVDSNGYALTSFHQTTDQKGVFVAGDLCGDLKHVVAACGQGAKAAYNANKYIIATNRTHG